MKRRLTALLLVVITALSLLVGCFNIAPESEPSISLDEIPAYSGKAYVKVNDNIPFFTEEEITATAFEDYSPLDTLGRCGVATASIGKEIMPTEERGDIGSVSPSGWKYNGKSNNQKYNGEYLYNRCHLIGHQLAGEDDNEKNLITGTRYLNIQGMLPFENQVADYVKETSNHVMLRVTPIYEGNNLVASGVLMEGYSVEDEGEGVSFCIYAYNVQPGVEINYKNGTNRASDDDTPFPEDEETEEIPEGSPTYVLNIGSGKYHLPTCSGVSTMKEENRRDYYGTLEELLEEYRDYSPCGTCKP